MGCDLDVWESRVRLVSSAVTRCGRLNLDGGNLEETFFSRIDASWLIGWKV